MNFSVQHRLSDVPVVEAIMVGQTIASGTTIRPATQNWHLVLTRHHGQNRAMLVGPWSAANSLPIESGADILWIKFRLGTFMPHRPVNTYVDSETALPEAAGSRTFWLHGSAWEFPTFENADTFVNRLVRDETLKWDPMVQAVLDRRQQELSARAIRHRFLRATGLTRAQIEQMERAQQAEGFLRRGMSILDTVEQAGYADQPHLTRSIKRWIGYTPAQLLRLASS